MPLVAWIGLAGIGVVWAYLHNKTVAKGTPRPPVPLPPGPSPAPQPSPIPSPPPPVLVPPQGTIQANLVMMPALSFTGLPQNNPASSADVAMLLASLGLVPTMPPLMMGSNQWTVTATNPSPIPVLLQSFFGDGSDVVLSFGPGTDGHSLFSYSFPSSRPV
jgi:hypothetical protein